MSSPGETIDIDRKSSILIPESSLAIKAFQIMNAGLQLPVIFEEMSLDEALDMLDAKEVAAVLAGAVHTTGEVIKAGINKFNPRRDETGAVSPKGERKLVSSYFVFERHGDDPFVLADCAVNPEPAEHELVQIAEQTAENARKLGIDPHVAFLSYSTLGSGHGNLARKTRAVAHQFKEKYPNIPSIGEVQFDAATDESNYELKTGQRYPGRMPPNVFIASNLDTGNNTYKILQSRKYGGGWTAVGPLLQGFEGGQQLHDLSRGVTPEALAVICKYIGWLSGVIPLDSETVHAVD